MPHPARQLLEEIRNELRGLRQLEEARHRAEDGTPLSRLQVAKLLRIDIKSTLDPLIRKKLIKTVPWTKGEVRIPVAEVRRLQREGIPVLEPKKPWRPRGRRAVGPAARGLGAEIRSIKIK